MTLLEYTMVKALQSGLLTVREDGGDPLIDDDGNQVPAIVDMFNIMNREKLMDQLLIQLAGKVARSAHNLIDFFSVPGIESMIFGHQLNNHLSTHLGRPIPMAYLIDGEIYGLKGNSKISPGAKSLAFQPVINFGRITQLIETLRNSSFIVRRIACICYFNNRECDQLLQENNLEVIYLFSIPKLVYTARKHNMIKPAQADDLLSFVSNPDKWEK